MKFSLNWLNDHLDLDDLSVSELDDLLTFAGIEVEGIEVRGAAIDKLVVAQVISSDKHPDADKLSVCQIDAGGDDPVQIVCGAKNYKVGDKIPLAQPGCELPGGFKIAPCKMRGVESHGMMCSASELGLAAESDGLLILDTDAAPGTPFSEIVTADTVFDVEITPNRPDLLSHLGLARELAALTGRELKGLTAHHREAGNGSSPAPTDTIEIQSPDKCSFYSGHFIRSVKIGPSPDWLKEKLEAVGLRPINNVVDVTNYVLHETGQPLHAFDLAKLKGGIQVRLANDGETLTALDGESYELNSTDLVIADSENAQAIAGVMGGDDSGVTETSTDILLEAAHFTASGVRQTARRFNLSTDSSYRFERGVDPLQTLGASALAVKLITALTGGQADEQTLIAGEVPEAPAPVTFSHDACRKLLGHAIADEEIDKILTSLGLERDDTSWKIPTWRLDLIRQVDLIEEVTRVFGLDNIPSRTLGTYSPASKEDKIFAANRSLRDQLVHLGFCEALTIKLISETQLADDLGKVSKSGLVPIRIKNPISDDYVYLRPSLVPSLLSVAKRNVNMGNSALRLFELGTVFSASPKGQEIEQANLALLITGDREPGSWKCPQPEATNFFDLRGILEALCPGQKVQINPITPQAGSCLALAAEIRLGKSKVGICGQLAPARARELGLEAPVLLAEFKASALTTVRESSRRYADLPRFPASSRDIAMEAPSDLPNGDIETVFAKIDEHLLESFSLFDVFTDPSGEKLAADKKSLAYSVTYRHQDRTLEQAEVDQAHEKILAILSKQLPVIFR
ncbi:MAG: phenylalanine--tRNA ligase subunit beta [Verrucomicrobia bacterium]|nr:phenylalanine--tRNA ligase subunit beta [Verrucomicrobiota bacterium]